MLLAAMAEIGAVHSLMVQAVALRLVAEDDPVGTLGVLCCTLAARPTMPAEAGAALDPSMSDHLAALTDDRTRVLIADVERLLVRYLGGG